MKCSYCSMKIRDDARLVVDFLIMPTLEEKNGVKIKNENGIFQNKIACRKCLCKISKGKLEM